MIVRASRRSLRGHFGVCEETSLPVTFSPPRRKAGAYCARARTFHRSVTHCDRFRSRSQWRDGSRPSPRTRQVTWVSVRPEDRLTGLLEGRTALIRPSNFCS